jgi:NAD(P)H dehydrogenase (quinone)
MPYNADSRFAPIAASDIALTAAKIFADPKEHGGRTYTLTGPVEYSHEELAAEVGRVLGKDLPYEQITATSFLELIGQPDDHAKLKHFEAVTIDQQEGLLAGVDDAARTIVGQPLVTVDQFINDNRASFELHYPQTAA